MSIIRSSNVLNSFNIRSAKMKENAISSGMIINNEWTDGEFNCFTAYMPLSGSLFSECGANVNTNPNIWMSYAGKITQVTVISKLPTTN